MPHPLSIDLRERVVGFVEVGHSRHAAAAHFQVSVCRQPDEGLSNDGEPCAKADGRTSPRQARYPSRVSSRSVGCQARHHHAGTGS